MTTMWERVHIERAALANDVVDLTDEQWTAPSLCAGWSVRETLAHLTANTNLNAVRWLGGVIRCRFDFDKQNAHHLADQLGCDPAETLARFRQSIDRTTKPPLPIAAVLGEVITHAEDIRRPLGIRHDYPTDSLTEVAELYQRRNSTVPSKRRSHGVRLEATDGPFRAGSGPLVSGPTLSLVMAMADRAAYLDDLAGDGAVILRERGEPS